MLAISRVGQHVAFTFLPNGMVYAEPMIVFPLDTHTAAGKAYSDFRADLMVRNAKGLTKTYNHFHDPNEAAPKIVQLRDLHASMDWAVLDAYGWTDVPTDCDFLLDYEIDEEEWGRKKKPYRYRWLDNVRDDVLARLLELNGQRAAEEAGARKAGRSKAIRSRPRKHR